MTHHSYQEAFTRLRNYFDSGATRPAEFRRRQLQALKTAVLQYEQEIYEALAADLKKMPEESWVTETGIVISEINDAIRNLSRWMQPEKVPTNLVNFPASSRILREPLGVVLIIGPWNYPFQLLLAPLVGAVAAGNCAVVKPSEHAPATSDVIKKIISGTFPEEYIYYTQGDGAAIIPAWMQAGRFDHLFFTGGTAVGKIIYKMAAEQLVPVTLELGGKSPCVIEADANIKVAARRITVTKFSNTGQTCTAPDYLLVHESRMEEMLAALKKNIIAFYSDRPEENYNYGKVINSRQFDRLVSYLQHGNIWHGGRHDREKLFIEPTILTDVPPGSPVMQDEIFGPLLPVFSYASAAEARRIIARNPNPLAFYVFTRSKAKEREWLESIAFGGGCVNNASWHFTNHHLPFGGRGMSGIGKCHGKFSFDTFSHQKAVMRTPYWFDPDIKYPPFKGRLRLFKWLFR